MFKHITITIDSNFDERVLGSGLDFIDNQDLKPVEYAEQINSPSSHIHEMRQKTLDAARYGAKIIIWQEFALTLDSSTADSFLPEMRNLADEENVYLLVSYARILNGKKVAQNVRLLVTPASQEIYFSALENVTLTLSLEVRSEGNPKKEPRSYSIW